MTTKEQSHTHVIARNAEGMTWQSPEIIETLLKEFMELSGDCRVFLPERLAKTAKEEDHATPSTSLLVLRSFSEE